ncbi:MAG TPA: RNase adapter RapZ [Terriglobales bacterium]|nr:RNase adapter RapZ [Terriglobales bacterium]
MAKKGRKARRSGRQALQRGTELVVITGMSGSGKASVLKALEDLGYYSVDNMPVELIPNFAELVRESAQIPRAALVADIREGHALPRLPGILRSLKRALPTRVIFLEASDEALLRRFSETRRPHPLGKGSTVKAALAAERRRLKPIRGLADMVVDTTKFNVHELRAHITRRFAREPRDKNIMVSCVSFGYKNGVPAEADLVFDVRFLPNPHFIPKYRPLTGRDAAVARYIRSFPQTRQFIRKVVDMLAYLLPHYVREGKSYLTIGFGCTGGQHRSVMIAEEVQQRLARAGYRVKVQHRDSPK